MFRSTPRAFYAFNGLAKTGQAKIARYELIRQSSEFAFDSKCQVPFVLWEKKVQPTGPVEFEHLRETHILIASRTKRPDGRYTTTYKFLKHGTADFPEDWYKLSARPKHGSLYETSRRKSSAPTPTVVGRAFYAFEGFGITDAHYRLIGTPDLSLAVAGKAYLVPKADWDAETRKAGISVPTANIYLPREATIYTPEEKLRLQKSHAIVALRYRTPTEAFTVYDYIKKGHPDFPQDWSNMLAAMQRTSSSAVIRRPSQHFVPTTQIGATMKPAASSSAVIRRPSQHLVVAARAKQAPPPRIMPKQRPLSDSRSAFSRHVTNISMYLPTVKVPFWN